MRLERYSGLPYSVSSDLGQLAVKRHFTSGMDCATAGAATAVAARPPAPAVLINFRLDSVVMPVLLLGGWASFWPAPFCIHCFGSTRCSGSTRSQALPRGRGTIGGSHQLRNCHLRRYVDQFGVALGGRVLDELTVTPKSDVIGPDLTQLYGRKVILLDVHDGCADGHQGCPLFMQGGDQASHNAGRIELRHHDHAHGTLG